MLPCPGRSSRLTCSHGGRRLHTSSQTALFMAQPCTKTQCTESGIRGHGAHKQYRTVIFIKHLYFFCGKLVRIFAEYLNFSLRYYMEPTVSLVLSAIAAYLVGSFSTAIVTCRLMGLEDPRSSGSNNPGATNVLRLGGKKAAIITLIGDMLKGLIPVLAVSFLFASKGATALAALFAFLGHVFPLYYRFRGGKGVATFYGAVLAMNWQVGLLALLIWLAMAAITKISSLSALVSIFLTPFVLWYFSQSPELTGAAALMSLIAFWRHKNNIRAILQGNEPRIGQKKAETVRK